MMVHHRDERKVLEHLEAVVLGVRRAAVQLYGLSTRVHTARFLLDVGQHSFVPLDVRLPPWR